jgi:aconitate hydratase
VVSSSNDEIELRPTQVLIEDATGTLACEQFERLGCDRVVPPLVVAYIDHNLLQFDDRNAEDQDYMRTFSARYGLTFSRPGNGISHWLHLERFGQPGGFLLGADSHTTTNGALGMLAIGAGATQIAVAMAGETFRVAPPTIAGVELGGQLPPWVQPKDVVLELLRRHGVHGGYGHIFEFYGDGVATLTATDRATICNMILETGAMTAVFPSDDRTREWLTEQQREGDFVALAADPGATYDQAETIDLGELEPLISLPGSPDNVFPVAKAAGTKARQVCVGSSVNSSYHDLALVAAVLNDEIVARDLDLTVSPGSRQILDTIVKSGVYSSLVNAGARILEPACGPCVGIGQAPPPGVVSVRTFNRNFPGRSGTPDDHVYLCSPATAAATALRGEITDPRTLGDTPALAPAPSDPAVDDRQIVPPLSPEDSRKVVLLKGTNIVPPPPVPPLPEQIQAEVLIVLPDNVDTGDMAPDGALGLVLRANIPACSQFMFRRFDPGFVKRVEALQKTPGWHGGIIVGGNNYGQGSSRDQAACAALYFGVRAVVTKSFARIHRSNLIGQGILPLTFAQEADNDKAKQGDEWTIPAVLDTLNAGGSSFTATSPAGDIALEGNFSPSERAVLLAGGLLAYARANPTWPPAPSPQPAPAVTSGAAS